MPTYDEEGNYLFSDSGGAPPMSPLVQQPGIGLAPQGDAQQQAIAKMGGMEKGLTALGEFGSAMIGRGSPLNARIGIEQREKMTRLAQFKAETDAIEDSVKWAQRLQGPDLENFVNTRVQQLNEQKPGLGDRFKVFASRPDLTLRFKEYAQHLPEHMQVMLKSNPEGFMKFAATAEGMKALGEAKDKSTLRLATKKAQTGILGWDKLAPPDVVARFKKDGVITASEFLEAQKYVPEAARLSDEEVEVASRTPGFWQALNIVSPQDEAKVNEKRLEGAGKAPTTRTIQQGGKNVQQEWDGTKWVEVGRGDKFKPGDEGVAANRDRNTELKLADDFSRDSKGFKEVKTQFSSTADYVAKGKFTSAGDRSLLFAYAKMNDPGDKVAVKDVQDIEKLGNVPERFIQAIKNVATGKMLPTDVRKDMYAEIKRKFGELNRAQRDVETDYTERAGRYKLDARNVVRKQSVDDDKPKVGDTVSRGGKTWKVVGMDKDDEPLVEEVR